MDLATFAASSRASPLNFSSVTEDLLSDQVDGGLNSSQEMAFGLECDGDSPVLSDRAQAPEDALNRLKIVVSRWRIGFAT